MDNQFYKWREEGKHLPDFLKDFHDQKDFFQLLASKLDCDEHEYIKNINSVQGHAYVIDAFLWFLSQYGYTIQKNKTKINFKNLQEDIKEMKKQQSDILISILKSTSK